MLQINDRLAQADFYSIKQSWALAKRIEANADSFIWSRVNALAISPICALGFATKAMADTSNFTYSLLKSAWCRRMETGNVQMGAVAICEQIRNVAGAVFGSLIGVVCPDKARNLFLAHTQEMLPRCLDTTIAAKLYAMTDAITKFFGRHGIDYRMTSGTFLGAIRHDGIIPWDDDVDLFLEPAATGKLTELVDNGTFLAETGLVAKWADDTRGWRAYFADGEQCPAILGDTKFPFVDLFTTVEQGDRIVYSSPLLYGWSPREYYTKAEWADQRIYTFGPTCLKGPTNPEPYFERAFGKRAMNLAYLLYHHKDFNLQRWPQRVYVDDHTPVAFNRGLYTTLVNQMDALAIVSS